MQRLPREFLTKVAQDYDLTEAQQQVFVECFSNYDKTLTDIAGILVDYSRSNVQDLLGRVYFHFSKEVTFRKAGPGKRADLHKFLMQQYQREQDEKSQGSTIPEPPDTGKDIDTLVQQAREMIRADIKYHCGTMRVLDRTQQIGLDDIYTHVNIVETITGRRRKGPTDLLQDCSAEDFERFGLGKRTEERVPGLKAVEKYSKLTILGKPGAGKTTFLKYLAIQCIDGKFLGDRIPIFITLRRFASSAKQRSLLKYIRKEHNCLSLPKILESGKALVLLDGLDEVPEEDTHRVREEILNFSDHYQFRHNHFVITCRIAAQEYTFEKFTEVEIADFDPTQIYNFAKKWFKNKPETFINHLENYPRIQELATSPLLLTLLCLIFEKTGDFPANRSELYEEGLDVLLGKWVDKPGIGRDPVYKKLSKPRKKDLFSKIALTTFESGHYFFKQKEAEHYITDYIRNLPGANTDEEVLQLDSEAVLRSIEAQHGLLIERAKRIYSFSHLTFHEYFAAQEIINQQSSEEALRKLVSHLTDRQWREVFLLAAGMSSRAERLLLLMKYEAEHLIDGFERLEQILNWVNTHPILGYQWDCCDRLRLIQKFYRCCDGTLVHRISHYISKPNNNFLVIGSRSIIFLLGFSKILNEDIAYKFVHHLIYSDKIKNLKKMPGCVWKEEVSGLWQSWSKEMKLNNSMLEIIDLINVQEYIHSLEEAQLLERYYHANELLLDCLNSDCNVSPEVREEIEETLLLPIAEIEKRKIEKRQSR